MSRVIHRTLSATLCLLCAFSARAADPPTYSERAVPAPGSVYREYAVVMGGSKAWRLTDPDAKAKGAAAFLPNPVLHVEIDDLAGARRAEIVIDRWGGHPGTMDKKFRFNGQPWIAIPEVGTIGPGKDPRCYMVQDSPVIEVPIAHLKQGRNTFEGTSGGQSCYDFKWGQWGWYGALLRVYFGEDKPHPAGRIVSPAPGGVIGEYPRIVVQAKGPRPIVRVDVVARYNGFDENGDGVFTDWHEFYPWGQIADHVGSAIRPPFAVVWDTRWVPDQEPRSIEMVARIQDADGVWSVTPVVQGLTLARRGSSVKLYPPVDVPERFWVRTGRGRQSSKVKIPADDVLAKATEAAVHLRTWNGMQESFTIGRHVEPMAGVDHNYAYTVRPVPVSALKAGDNEISFASDDHDHGPEILWPGPALTVRYGKAPKRPAAFARPSRWVFPESPFRAPVEVMAAADGPRPLRQIEIPVDFTALLRRLGARFPFEESSLRVVEIDQARGQEPRRIPEWWRFERAADFDPKKRARGTLTVLIGGQEAGTKRVFHLYFGAADRRHTRLVLPTLTQLASDDATKGKDQIAVKAPEAQFGRR
jgi:hypothetical protein